MAEVNNIAALDMSQVLSVTHRPDGSVATVITKGNSGKPQSLIQYSPDGSVMFVQEFKNRILAPEDITYRKDGTVSSITKHDFLSDNRTVTLYDENGGVSTSISLTQNDQVNFKDGQLSSIIKYTGNGFSLEASDMDETQYGPDGKIIASVHKVRYHTGDSLLGRDGGKWLTTSETTYYPNGQKASTITYKQKTKTKRTGHESWGDMTKQEEADSYRSSIIQYDEKGNISVSVKLNEQDEVNYSGGKIATITRRDEDNNLLSTTNYDENGKIASLQNYDKSGKIISSVTYENGRPVGGSQPETGEGYENIFATSKPNKKTSKKSSLTKKLQDVDSKAAPVGKRLKTKSMGE